MDTQTLAAKVDLAIKLDKDIRGKKRELDAVKAELQTAVLSEFENKNIKYVQLFGVLGSCEAAYKEKFEIDNYARLVDLLGDLVKDKVKRKEEVKYEAEGRFKEALIVLVNGTYRHHDVDAILTGMGLDAKQVKTAKKKLKGEYRKDRELLEALGVTGAREEELDAIREAKNMELVERFFEMDKVNPEEIKKCIFVEESLSIGLNYEASA